MFHRSLIGLAIACLLMAGSASAQTELHLFVNVLANNDFDEEGAAADSVTTSPPPGWLVTGNATQAIYGGSSIFPASGFGPQFLAGGPNSALSTASQQFVVTDPFTQAFIDIEFVPFELRGWLGGRSSERDEATVELQFRDALDNLLKGVVLGPVTAADRNGQTGLLQRWTSGPVPSETRRVDCIVSMTRLDGSYDNAYVDALDLTFIVPDAVERTSWSAIKSLYRGSR